MSERLRKDVLYPTASEYHYKYPPHSYRVRWTGEKRCPREGEWFLSGAVVEGYLSPGNLSTEYHIAKLVRVEVETKIKEVE